MCYSLQRVVNIWHDYVKYLRRKCQGVGGTLSMEVVRWNSTRIYGAPALNLALS